MFSLFSFHSSTLLFFVSLRRKTRKIPKNGFFDSFCYDCYMNWFWIFVFSCLECVIGCLPNKPLSSREGADDCFHLAILVGFFFCFTSLRSKVGYGCFLWEPDLTIIIILAWSASVFKNAVFLMICVCGVCIFLIIMWSSSDLGLVMSVRLLVCWEFSNVNLNGITIWMANCFRIISRVH